MGIVEEEHLIFVLIQIKYQLIIRILNNVMDIFCAGFHSILLTENNSILTFADNSNNQFSQIYKNNQIFE